MEMTKPNSSSLFVPSLTLLILISLLHCVHGDTLQENCNKIAGRSVSSDFCVRALSADPASRTADLHQLGLIAVKLTSKKATALKTKVEQLVNDPATDKTLKSALRDCLEVYGDAVDNADEAFESLKARRMGDTRTALTTVTTSSSTCETSLSEMGVKSPVSKQMVNFKKIAAIPLTIASLLPKMGH